MTDPFVLSRPSVTDVDDVFELNADPRVWEHSPAGRFTSRAQAVALVRMQENSWSEAGLGPWIVRDESGALLGTIGVLAHPSKPAWNLAYRLRPEAHGRGIATAVSRHAIEHAREVRPDLPVLAFIQANNPASAAVAERVGLELVYDGPDANDHDVRRLIYSDRALSQAQELLLLPTGA